MSRPPAIAALPVSVVAAVAQRLPRGVLAGTTLLLATAAVSTTMTSIAGPTLRALCGFAAASAVAVSARRRTGTYRRAAGLIAAGIAVWTLTDAAWDLLDRLDTPPASLWFSLLDVCYLTVYPMLFAALVLFVVSRGDQRLLHNMVDGTILAFGVVLLLRAFVIHPDPAASTLDGTFTAAYPFADALLLAGITWLVPSQWGRNVAAWLIGVGIGLVFCADIVWEMVRHADGYYWLDTLYTVGYVLTAAALLHPSVAALEHRSAPARWERHGRVVCLVGALFVVPAVALFGERRDVVTLVSAAALVVAIAVRFMMFVAALERTREGLESSERRFRRLATTVPVAVYDVDENLRIGFTNAEGGRLIGSEATGAKLPDIIETSVYPDDRDKARAALADFVAGHRIQLQLRILDNTGVPRWIALDASPDVPPDLRFAGGLMSATDISLLKEAEAGLALQAHHDALTGLPNRRSLQDRLGGALKRLTRQPGSVAVLFLDLDGFKKVNDTLGHETGDELLRVVAGRIQASIRDVDTAARIGGDEFVVVLENVTGDAVAAASRVATKLIAAVGTPFDLPAGRAVIGTSVGIAVTADPRADPDALLRAADDAMYRAKSAGRGRFELAPHAVSDR